MILISEKNKWNRLKGLSVKSLINFETNYSVYHFKHLLEGDAIIPLEYDLSDLMEQHALGKISVYLRG